MTVGFLNLHIIFFCFVLGLIDKQVFVLLQQIQFVVVYIILYITVRTTTY